MSESVQYLLLLGGGVVIGGIITIFASWWFSRKPTKQLKVTTSIFADYIEGKITGGGVEFRRNKKGELIGVHYTVPPDPAHFNVNADKIDLQTPKKENK